MQEHKYSELALEISKEFNKMCNMNACGECKYAFMRNCKILFVLDYLENKRK